MRLSNSDSSASYTGPFAEYLRLQAEFQTRLTDETIKYLQGLQQLSVPGTPGSFFVSVSERKLHVSGRRGTTVSVEIELENHQRIYTIVNALLGPLSSTAGVTWFPSVRPEPALLFIAPGQNQQLTLNIAIPDTLPIGEYHGVLSLAGFSGEPIAVSINCEAVPKSAEPKSAEPESSEGDERRT